MITCCIVGQESILQETENFINKYPITKLISSSADYEMGMMECRIIRPNIIFVNREEFGINDCLAIEELSTYSAVVLISTHRDFAYHAFESYVSDYLLVGFSFARFEKCINKLIRLSLVSFPLKRKEVYQFRSDCLFVKMDLRSNKEYKIQTEKISYIEALQNYVILYTIDGKKVVSHSTMKDMEARLTPFNFIRIHKSFIINFDKIFSASSAEVTIEGFEKKSIPIGNTYKKIFHEFKNYGWSGNKKLA